MITAKDVSADDRRQLLRDGGHDFRLAIAHGPAHLRRQDISFDTARRE